MGERRSSTEVELSAINCVLKKNLQIVKADVNVKEQSSRSFNSCSRV